MRIQKASTAARILAEGGLDSLGRYALYRSKVLCFKDRWLLGRVIELLGNSARVDGCIISLDSPAITTRLKSRFLTGLYEAGERYLIRKYMPRDLPVIELGACIGVVSCLVSRLLTVPGRHLVVEANIHLLPTLRTNRDRNGCQFEILNAAVAYDTDTVTFYLSDYFVGGSIARETQESIIVQSTTLQQLLVRIASQRVSLICDIEGSEIDLVEKEGKVLQEHVAWFFVEMHRSAVGESTVIGATSRLKEMGFRFVESFGGVHAYHNEG